MTRACFWLMVLWLCSGCIYRSQGYQGDTGDLGGAPGAGGLDATGGAEALPGSGGDGSGGDAAGGSDGAGGAVLEGSGGELGSGGAGVGGSGSGGAGSGGAGSGGAGSGGSGAGGAPMCPVVPDLMVLKEVVAPCATSYVLRCGSVIDRCPEGQFCRRVTNWATQQIRDMCVIPAE